MTDGNNASPPSLSDAIERLMANPQLLSSIASAIGTEMPKKADETIPEAKEVSAEPEAKTVEPQRNVPDIGQLVSTISPMLSSLGSKEGSNTTTGGSDHHRRDRETLLCALKPYVSDGRREAIDHIIRISQITDVLRQMGGKGG